MESATASKQTTFIRFSMVRRIEHHVNAVLFVVLVATGLAQRYFDAGWSQWLISRLGGIDSTRLLHRYTGLVLGLLILAHVGSSLYGLLRLRWRPTIVINQKDFSDAITNLRYYVVFTDSPSRGSRFDYKQKWEYWGVLLGSIFMTVTGLILWFPTTVFQVFPFFPGQVVPAAKAAHSNEAMLAFLIIVVWHIYNSVFSPEVFPLDTSIFTGRISAQRMMHEHPLVDERGDAIRFKGALDVAVDRQTGCIYVADFGEWKRPNIGSGGAVWMLKPVGP